MPWRTTALTRALGIEVPIVQAPMAGGITTPALVAAVSDAGGLGSLGTALLTPDELRDAIGATRALTDRPFAVNLMAHERHPPPAGAPAEPVLADQLAVVEAEGVPVLSCTFGLPPGDALERLRARGTAVIATATTVEEAHAAAEAGIDVVCAQGAEAGGHRGTFLGRFEDAMIGTLALVPAIADRVPVPVVAAGGIMDGRGIAAALALGADGVQLGTAFLPCHESGAAQGYKAALLAAGEDATCVTDRLSGRPARALRTRLVAALQELGGDVAPFPFQRTTTVQCARALGDPESALGAMWAGQGCGQARALGAAELVAALVRETEAALPVA